MLKAGTKFAGRFTVIREVAIGGMGAVYEVTDAAGRPRALKVMLPHLVGDAKLRVRFDTEARVGATIDSDHVVAVYDSDTAPTTAEPWILMELLAGETLDARIHREGRLAPAEVARVMKQVGHALAAAHVKGVLHLDLKPANLFLAKPRLVEQASVVKVLDFGIAREIAEGRLSAELTTGGGTEAWMAPEQGDHGASVKPSVDVWPLGLIAFYLLTGREYWTLQNLPETRRSRAALQKEVYFAPLAPASVRAAELGVGGVLPAGFDAWFARCVDREPAARWPEGGAAVEALLKVLAPVAVPVSVAPSAPPPPPAGVLPPTIVARPPAPPALTEVFPPVPAALKGQTEVMPSRTPPPTSRTRPDAPKRRSAMALVAVPTGLLLLGGTGWALFNGERHPTATAPELVPSVPTSAPPIVPAPVPVPAVTQTVRALGEIVGASNPWVPLGTGGLTIQTHEVSVGEYRAWRPGAVGTADDLPMVNVSWEDASAFCRDLGGGAGLPLAETWKLALGPRRARGWYVTRVTLATGAVGTNREDVSPLGVRDLVGNVREWTASATPGGHRVMGAATGDLPDERVDRVTSGDVATGRDARVGFRCARVAGP